MIDVTPITAPLVVAALLALILFLIAGIVSAVRKSVEFALLCFGLAALSVAVLLT